MSRQPVSLLAGRALRVEEDELLKTSIVASIGDPAQYKEGIWELNGRHVPTKNITYDYLARGFYQSGVDVIRLNLSYLDGAEMVETFLQTKRALVRCEGLGAARKRIAVLADLPGPKIRLSLKPPTKFEIGQEFLIHLARNVSGDSIGTVLIDGKPLKHALERIDDRTQVHHALGEEYQRLVENVLGGMALEQPRKPTSYLDMVEAILRGMDSDEGQRIVLGDGEVSLQVVRGGFDRQKATLNCRVLSAQRDPVRKPRVGFTLKGVDFNIPSFTETDEKKVSALLKADYERTTDLGSEPIIAFIALSFAQTADDVLRARRNIEDQLHRLGLNKSDARLQAPSLVAKIETSKGLANRRYIIDVADGIMVARGDLGLQMEIERVPAEQKKLIRLCSTRGKPVITATEMLKSMVKADQPTRAEGTDVFNAIVDGSDAVMMSGETSSGCYPFHAIRKMIAIAMEAERFHEYRGVKGDELRRIKTLAKMDEFLKDDIARIGRNSDRFVNALGVLALRRASIRQDGRGEAGKEKRRLKWREEIYEEKLSKSKNQVGTNLITQAACKMSERDGIRGILAASTSGRTVRMISRLRPTAIVIGAAHDPLNTRKLSLSYGVLPICMPEVSDEAGPDGVFEKCAELISSDAFLNERLLSRHKGPSQVIFTAGMPLRKPGTTNLIQTRELERPKKTRRNVKGKK